MLWRWELLKLFVDKWGICKYKLGNGGCITPGECQIERSVSKADLSCRLLLFAPFRVFMSLVLSCEFA